MDEPTREDRVRGLLLGTAVGDALGLPFEGMSATKSARAFRTRSPHYVGWGRASVSDDTEQAALLAQALVTKDSTMTRSATSNPARDTTARDTPASDAPAFHHSTAIVRAFRRSLIGWFLRLPFGIGFGTLRACARLCVGLRGSSSAGNGAMMRAPVLGALPAEGRVDLAREIARLTHSDPRAVDAAVFATELAAACLSHAGPADPRIRRRMVVGSAAAVQSAEIHAAVEAGLSAAERPLAEIANTGFALHSVALCVASFVRDGASCRSAITSCIAAGGDTDTHAAIVGAWTGALYGAQAIDAEHIALLQRGPFGNRHLSALASAIVHDERPPRWSPFGALLRNLSLYPLVLAHGIVRVFRW